MSWHPMKYFTPTLRARMTMKGCSGTYVAEKSDKEFGMSSGARLASLTNELVATKPTLVLSMPQNYLTLAV
jgi:hypothetical protein